MNEPYSVTTGPKQDTRVLFTKMVQRHIPAPTNILLMPGEDAHDAKLLRATFPRAKIKGLDNDEEKAEHIGQAHWHCIDDIFPGSVADYAFYSRQRDNPDNPGKADVYPRMDAIWLDHTGGCTRHNVKNLLDIVRYAAKDKCVFAATFTANPRGGTESADDVIRKHAWFSDEERYDGRGQHWANAKSERAMMNTHSKVANAVRTAIDTRDRDSYLRCEVLRSMSYQARQGSTKMHFFVLYIERL